MTNMESGGMALALYHSLNPVMAEQHSAVFRIENQM